MPPLDWQMLATIVAVTWALAYVGRATKNVVAAKRAGSGCGSCASCPSADASGTSSSTSLPQTQGFVGVETLTRSR